MTDEELDALCEQSLREAVEQGNMSHVCPVMVVAPERYTEHRYRHLFGTTKKLTQTFKDYVMELKNDAETEGPAGPRNT